MSGRGSLFGSSLFGERGASPLGERRGSGAAEVIDLNLTPLMDVMSNILFFLLATFGAAIVSFLAASVPVEADEQTAPTKPRTDQVLVTLRIAADGYTIRLNNEEVPADQLEALGGRLPRGANGFDLAGLEGRLAAIKARFPGSDTLVIAPADDVLYEAIIDVMEASRETLVEGRRVRLFHKHVVAGVVQEERTP